jgi:membrane associated rhomboid family serine protease
MGGSVILTELLPEGTPIWVKGLTGFGGGAAGDLCPADKNEVEMRYVRPALIVTLITLFVLYRDAIFEVLGFHPNKALEALITGCVSGVIMVVIHYAFAKLKRD